MRANVYCWPMSTGKSLSKDENRRVRAAVQQLLTEHGDNQSRLAPLLGIRQGTLSAFLREKHGAGFGLARRVARLMGIEVQELLGGGPSDAVIEYDERYPNRGRAATAAQALGYSEEAIREVQSMALKSDTDLEPEEWLDMMRAAHRRQELVRFPHEEEKERQHQEHRAAERAKEDAAKGTFEERLARAKERQQKDKG